MKRVKEGNSENDGKWTLQVYCYVDTYHNTTSLFFRKRYVDMSSEESKGIDSNAENLVGGREKVCKVCGDKAFGYNFNAITCESCKAFFRRNALKNKEFKCPFNKKCEINPVTRRFCQLCRLIKCFEIGMKKEYIMSEDDKKEKRRKIEKNRAQKKRAVDDSSDSSNGSKAQSKPDDDANEEETEDDEEVMKVPLVKPVKINPLNMASESKKIYHKKQLKYSSSGESPVPFPSPGLPESSSPEMSPVTESKTWNLFNGNSNETDSNQSRSVEIYQMSKSKDEVKMAEGYNKDSTESNIIKIILDSEFSKSSEVYTNSTLGSKEEEKMCSPNNGQRETFDDYVICDTNIIELVKNSNNILLRCTKDGKKILVINKDSEETGNKGLERSNNIHRTERQRHREMEFREEPIGRKSVEVDASTPLLTSLINSKSCDSGFNMPSSKLNHNEKILQDIPRDSSLCLTNSIDSILSEAIKLEYEAYSSMNPRMNSRELNDAERAKLNELIVANKGLLAPLEDDLTKDDFQFNAITGCGPSMLVDVLNLTAVAIRRLIKMSKKINAFKNMCQDDQIALLKGGCTEMMILRSAMTYDPDRDSWKIPQSKEKLMNIKVDVLKEAGGKVFEEHQRFLQTFDPKWRNDENIMLILSAIALFTPDRPKVVHYDVIKLEQNSYYYLLRRYLESIYHGCEARLTFLKLIHKISELHKLNEDHVRVYLDVNPQEIEPLLIEIFDLKPH